MNLALEYYIRTGEFKHMLEFPYSMFLTCYGSNDKLVITIHSCFNSNNVAVKHWKVSDCRPELVLPPFREYEVSRHDLFTSDKTVVPHHSPLWYRADPFRAGRKQNTDPPYAECDEKEYNEACTMMLNTRKHQLARTEWLWRAFLNAYNIELKGFISTSSDTQHSILRQHAPQYAHHWNLWSKYLLNFSTKVGQVAGELLFHKEYIDLAKREGRVVDLPDDDPPDRTTMSGHTFGYPSVYSSFLASSASSWPTISNSTIWTSYYQYN
jgi:hypothetical protein